MEPTTPSKARCFRQETFPTRFRMLYDHVSKNRQTYVFAVSAHVCSPTELNVFHCFLFGFRTLFLRLFLCVLEYWLLTVFWTLDCFWGFGWLLTEFVCMCGNLFSILQPVKLSNMTQSFEPCFYIAMYLTCAHIYCQLSDNAWIIKKSQPVNSIDVTSPADSIIVLETSSIVGRCSAPGARRLQVAERP